MKKTDDIVKKLNQAAENLGDASDLTRRAGDRSGTSRISTIRKQVFKEIDDFKKLSNPQKS